ncbi:hypothetical protein [Halomarina pelagica]|uniref:hypothetical protein n=1 Tax=Halomarina pelagica TaxID=2961599 RepID=UPI0020C4AB4E|nr:hypothetical protein [Halomarina sp. BND7]
MSVAVIDENDDEAVIDATYDVNTFRHLNLNDELDEGTPYVVTVSVAEGNEATFRIDETETKVVKIESNGEIHVVTVEEL